MELGPRALSILNGNRKGPGENFRVRAHKQLVQLCQSLKTFYVDYFNEVRVASELNFYLQIESEQCLISIESKSREGVLATRTERCASTSRDSSELNPD